MRSVLFVLLVACGGSKSSTTQVSNQPVAPPSPPTAPAQPMAPTQPSCPDAADMKCAVDTMQYFSDQVCACKDKACADKVNADLTTWATDMAKHAKHDQQPDPDVAKRAADIMTKYTECMTKVMMEAGTPPPDPCGGGANPCGG